MNWTIKPPEKPALWPTVWSAAAAALGYLALWGGLSDMAALSTLGLPALLPGFVLLFLTALLPSKKPLFLFLSAAGAVLLFWTAFRFTQISRGLPLLLDRLFLQSEEKQRYLYEKFSVTGTVGDIAELLMPLGMLTGVGFGLCARTSRLAAQLASGALLLCLAAWLGLAPGPVWMLLLLLAFLAALVSPRRKLPAPLRLLPLLLALLLGAFYLAASPGEAASVRALSETARDRLALHTMAYGNRAETQEDPGPAPQETRPYALTPHEPEQAEEAKPSAWLLPLFAVLLTLLLLFVPAVWSDRLRRRRAVNRAGLDSQDLGERCRASLLYALRWLTECGMEERNQPISAYTAAVSALDPDLGRRFSALLPRWQEAAYSEHPIEAGDAEAFQSFLSDAQALARSRMSWRRRLRINYLTGL